MADGLDNPGLDLKEENVGKNVKENSSLGPSTQDGIAARSSSVETTFDKHENAHHAGQVSSKDGLCTIVRNDVPPSKWPVEIADVIVARRGIIYALLSALFYSAQGLCLALISTRRSVFQVMVLAMPGMLLGSLLGMAITRAPLPKRKMNYFWIFFNGMSVSVGTATFALSVRYLDVADVVAVSYSSLVFVCVLSWIILREPLRLLDFVFSFVALAGVVFIARPHPLFGKLAQEGNDDNQNYLTGIALALGTALSMAIRTVSYSKQNKLEIDKFVLIFGLAFAIALSNIVVCTALNQWRLPYLLEWMYATGVGLSAFFAHLFLVMSLKLEKPAMVSIILTFDIVFSFLWQYIILSVTPAWTSYGGSLLLIIASVGTTLYKKRQTETLRTNEVSDTGRDVTSNDSIEIS